MKGGGAQEELAEEHWCAGQSPSDPKRQAGVVQ